MVEVSVVTPVYGCSACLEALHRRLTDTLSAMGIAYEIVFVDDRSPDGAWEQLERLAESDPAVRAIRLSRNFGQQAAVAAGLEHSEGRWVAIIDCDLQDPPELIPQLYERALEGNQVVFANQRREGMSRFRRATWRLYYRCLNLFAGTDMNEESSSYCLLSRQVVAELLGFRDLHRHHRLILDWLGFETASVRYEQSERHSGSSSYDLRSLVGHALDGLFFQNTMLLRWVVYLGFALATAGIAFAGYVLVAELAGSFQPGWSSLAIFTLTIGGFIIVSTGITGLYVGRVFELARGRPLFVIEKDTGR